jgi:hypothetical protein
MPRRARVSQKGKWNVEKSSMGKAIVTWTNQRLRRTTRKNKGMMIRLSVFNA